VGTDLCHGQENNSLRQLFCAVTFSRAIRPTFITQGAFMDANKAGYWIAVGVLALGLSGEYRHGNFVALHKAAARAELVAGRITVRAEESLAMAMGRVSRGGSAADNLLASADASAALRDRSEVLRDRAQDQAEFMRQRVRAQAEVMRARAAMRRAAIEKMRSQRDFQFSVLQRVKVVCPKLGTQIVANTGLDLSDVSADVDVSENF
jgi:hypothetical protein